MQIFNIVIPGRPIVKKNTQRIVGYGKKRRAIYSPLYTAWERGALLIFKMKDDLPFIDFNVMAEFSFYFENHSAEPDTSNLIEGPQDLLKKAGVISDDKIIKRVLAEKFFGETPRTEIRILRLEAI